ncbi:MAG: hypothetical protein JF595_10590 [Sphingomonadales bacterium]|nr:hypothetical protein [Sphingomonadales bacterium]
MARMSRVAFDKLRLSGVGAWIDRFGRELAQAGAKMAAFENRSEATCWS